MGTWYEDNIEAPIRDAVKLLRDNGFNTECSCGSEMYVQCQYIPEGEIKRLYDLLFNHGYKNFEVNVTVKVINGHAFSSLDLRMLEAGIPGIPKRG